MLSALFSEEDEGRICLFSGQYHWGVENGADAHIPGIANGIETLFREMVWIANTSRMDVAVERKSLRMAIPICSLRHGLSPQTVSLGHWTVGRCPQCPPSTI